MKKVAVITRTKDRPVFLSRALESVSSQTYSNYVHVVVNDGGNIDEVEQVIASSTAPQNIKSFHRETASGAPDTIFNESIDRVQSDYVVIHDDDDTWHPEFLERTVALLEGGSKGVVVRTDKITERLAEKRIIQLKKEPYQPDVKSVSLYRQCIDNQMTPIAFIYRRDVYEEIGKYDSSLPVVGDWEFGIRFLLRYDVDFLDPGFALANYHHRKVADNSFAAHQHRRYFTIVANRYLREEFAGGRLGPGYVMSSIRYQQGFLAKLFSRIAPRIFTEKLKKRIG